MRSEKERSGGLGSAVAVRAPSGREKLLAAEVQLPRELPRREPDTPPPSSSGCGGATSKPREEKRTTLSKVVLRRLPPGLTKERLEELLRPLPAHDYFEVVAADLSLYPHLFSRAYINFRNPDDILLFRDRFDGYIFIGNKARRTTPLLEYIKNRKLEKQRIREEKREERRRRELEKKRLREEEKRKRREEERYKRKEADKQKKTEKEVRIKLLKKPEKGEEPVTEKPKQRGEEIGTGDEKQETYTPCTTLKVKPIESQLEAPREKNSRNNSSLMLMQTTHMCVSWSHYHATARSCSRLGCPEATFSAGHSVPLPCSLVHHCKLQQLSLA
ncbi:regulator of nonsense transcripts 3A isoform 4-T4 [Thomomys bottae]